MSLSKATLTVYDLDLGLSLEAWDVKLFKRSSLPVKFGDINL